MDEDTLGRRGLVADHDTLGSRREAGPDVLVDTDVTHNRCNDGQADQGDHHAGYSLAPFFRRFCIHVRGHFQW
jgi:hypothetical protein